MPVGDLRTPYSCSGANDEVADSEVLVPVVVEVASFSFGEFLEVLGEELATRL